MAHHVSCAWYYGIRLELHGIGQIVLPLGLLLLTEQKQREQQQ